jgi:hypothetical protein
MLHTDQDFLEAESDVAMTRTLAEREEFSS